jgi:hypothetical protein
MVLDRNNFAGQQNWEPPAGREPKAEAQDVPSQQKRPDDETIGQKNYLETAPKDNTCD